MTDIEPQVELDDLFPDYPDQDDPDMSTLITGMEEFSSIPGLPGEVLPEEGGYFRHQKQMNRFMWPYDVAVAFDDPGTGKSCLALYPADRLLHDPDSGIIKVVVLTKNPTLEDEMKEQLVYQCTQGRYLTEKVKKAEKERGKKTILGRIIQQAGYEFYTFGTFANKIAKMTESQIRSEFSQTFFVIDEMHFLRTDLEEINGEIVAKVRPNKTEGKKADRSSLGDAYNAIIKVFGIAQWIKVLGLTATPMINSIQEIGPIFNMILFAAKRNPFPVDTDFNAITAEELYERLKGLISVVRTLDIGVELIIPGEEISGEVELPEPVGTIEATSFVYPTMMSEFQTEGYSNASEENSTVYTDERQAANFIFPDGSWGNTGFKKYVRINKGPRGKGATYVATSKLEKVLQDPKLLRKHGAKIWQIVEEEVAFSKNERPGKCWTSSTYVENGIVLLGLALEAQGFELYTGNTPAVKRLKEGSFEATLRNKRPRYAIITQNQTKAQSRNIRNLYNAVNNMDGEYLQLLGGSPVAQTGISIFDTVRVRNLGPFWNKGTKFQSESRAFRSISHDRLLMRLRRESGDPDARVKVKIYNHAIQVPKDFDVHNIDYDIYLRAEAKEIPIRGMQRKYSSIAWDCRINYYRNVLGVNSSGSAFKYNCYFPPPNQKQVSNDNYIALYSEEEIERIMKILREKIFQQRSEISQEELYDSDFFRYKAPNPTGGKPIVKEHSPMLIDMAVQKMVTARISLLDRFGFPGFLQQSRGQIFLQRSFPERESGVDIVFYESRVFGRVDQGLEEISQILLSPHQNQKIDELHTIDTFDDKGFRRFENLLFQLDAPSRASVLEKSLSATALIPSEKRPEFDQDVQVALENYWFKFSNPEAMVLELEEIGGRNRPGQRLRSGKLDTKQQEALAAFVPKRDGRPVFVHTLLVFPASNVQYSSIEKKFTLPGTLRVLEAVDEGKTRKLAYWRDANSLEAAVFRELIVRRLTRRIEEVESNFDLYGIRDVVTRDFRIRDLTKEDRKAREDARYRHSGRACEHLETWQVIEMLIRLDAEPPQIPSNRPDLLNVTAPEMRDYLVEKHSIYNATGFSDEMTREFYLWYLGGDSKPKLCEKVQEILIRSGRVVDL